MESSKDKMKTRIRRTVCNEIKTLSEAPSNVLHYFFVDQWQDWDHGDMVADESGNLWSFVVAEYGVFLNAVNADDQGKMVMLRLE